MKDDLRPLPGEDGADGGFVSHIDPMLSDVQRQQIPMTGLRGGIQRDADDVGT